MVIKSKANTSIIKWEKKLQEKARQEKLNEKIKKINWHKHTSFEPPVKRSTIRLSISNVNLTEVYTGAAATISLSLPSTSTSKVTDLKPEKTIYMTH